MPLLPESVKGNCILHVSDTPSSFYKDLKRLLEFLRPEALVHTGDIADDVKLEIQPSDRPRFRKNLLRFFCACSPISKSRVVIACGNHDDFKMVRELAGEMVVFEKYGRLNVCGIDTAVSHYLSHLPSPGVSLNLYGHDDTPPPDAEKDAVFLNGLLGIGVIEIEPFRVHVVPYPFYVDRDRMFRIRAGF